MVKYISNGFYARRASCHFQYNPSFFQTEVNENNVKVDNLERDTIYCKNDVDYINKFIEYIKDKVIKNCKNLGSVNIILATFDRNNIFHKIIVVVANTVRSLLKIKEKINIYKSIFVLIEYENQPVFMGNLNFNGLD